MQIFAGARVPADQDRLEEADQPEGIGLGGVGGRAQEGVALDARIGGDAQQAQVAASPGVLRALGLAGGRNVVPGKQGKLDSIDLHGSVSRFAPVIPAGAQR
jgi:hypothetical protein